MILVIIKMHPNGTNSSSCLNQMQMLQMWPNPQETVNLVTFTEEILNGKLYLWEPLAVTLAGNRKIIISHHYLHQQHP